MKTSDQKSIVAPKLNGDYRLALTVGVALLLVSSGAFAAADEMGDGICKIVNMLTGKWLFGFTILATLGAGAALLFGGEITDGLKSGDKVITEGFQKIGPGSKVAPREPTSEDVPIEKKKETLPK